MASLQSRKGITLQYDSDDSMPSNVSSNMIPHSPSNTDSDFIYGTKSKGIFTKNHNHGNRTEGWWTIGATGKGHGIPLTHQSARLSMTGNRVFSSHQDDLWDLTDSILELYENEHRLESLLHLGHRRRPVDFDMRGLSIQDWIARDASNGFVRVYAPDISNFTNSQLVPCTLDTSVHKICIQLGININSLHVQLHGDVIRRLDPRELPLLLQNDYLVSLGYTDISRIQEEGHKEELAYLVKFYSGKPMHDSTFSRSQLKAFVEIKKGGMLHQWVWRLCIISGTRLLIYKDKQKSDDPSVIQLAKGSIEEVKVKGRELCLKLTSTLQGDKQIFISFTNEQEFGKWMKKCKKATDKLPTTADLSNCHLEYLPENIFINDQLAMLNLQHNALKQRPNVDDVLETIGWIEDLNRFSCLRSLNLADNHLETFPLSLCSISTLAELNLANNQLTEIPPEIQQLTNLQALHIHNNHLHTVPDQLTQLRRLFILVLAFNRFTSLPPVIAQMTNVRYSEVENIIMAGNQIERLSSETLIEMKYVKKLDLRLNQLVLTTVETMKYTMLEHLTHLDIRDNQVIDLDSRPIKTLEYLNCERNAMTSLHLNGTSLKFLFASSNCLELIQMSPKPEWLQHIDVSDNCLESLPDWVCDCLLLQKIVASKNFLQELPPRIFLGPKKLKCLRLGHNQLRSLPTEMGNLLIEELQLQNNYLLHLPPDLLHMANKLRILNVAKNRLTHLPPVNENQDLNKVQELYLSNNHFGSSVMEVVSGYPRLKILHLAQNELMELCDSEIQKLELLQELNVSTNQLHSLPVALGDLSKLVVLRAHSNHLNTLPDFHNAKSLRVLDVGHNQLFNVSVTNLMASQLNLLDMSLNSQLKVDPKEFKTVKNRKSICLVDLSGQNRRLPGLPQRNHVTSLDDTLSSDNCIPWKVGFSETSGIRNKLCISMIRQLKFGSENESLFGMFDGGRNNEVPKILMETMADIVCEEMSHHKTSRDYMKYSLLTAHRRLKLSGQRLGSTAVLCHLERHEASNQLNHFTLNIANVGDTEAVLCHRGEAVVLTRKFTTTADREECLRIYKSDGIITEDCKVNGITHNTRLLGCSYLSPLVIPNPFTATIALRNDDEFIIIANGQFWEHVSYDEAVEEIYEIGNPIVAAKHLQDLAQGYGARENIAILVIRLNTDTGPSLSRLRPINREMSIDDVEAAMQHEAMKVRRAMLVTRKNSNVKSLPKEKLLYGQKAEINSCFSGEPQSGQLLSFKPHNQQQSQTRLGLQPPENVMQKSSKHSVDGSAQYNESQNMEEYVKNTVEIEKPSGAWKKSGAGASVFSGSSATADSTAQQPKPTLRQRFIKKNEWDSMAMKRSPAGVKDDMPLSPVFFMSPPPTASIERSPLLTGKLFMPGDDRVLPQDENTDSDLFPQSSASYPTTSDHSSPSLPHSYISDVKEVGVSNMMAPSTSQMKAHSSVANAADTFEKAAPQQTDIQSYSLFSPTLKTDNQLLKKPALESYKKFVPDDLPLSFKSGHILDEVLTADDQPRSRKPVISSAYFNPVNPLSDLRKQPLPREDFSTVNGSVEANLYQKVTKIVEHPLGVLCKAGNQFKISANLDEFKELEILEDGQTKMIEIARL